MIWSFVEIETLRHRVPLAKPTVICGISKHTFPTKYVSNRQTQMVGRCDVGRDLIREDSF